MDSFFLGGGGEGTVEFRRILYRNKEARGEKVCVCDKSAAEGSFVPRYYRRNR